MLCGDLGSQEQEYEILQDLQNSQTDQDHRDATDVLQLRDVQYVYDFRDFQSYQDSGDGQQRTMSSLWSARLSSNPITDAPQILHNPPLSECQRRTKTGVTTALRAFRSALGVEHSSLGADAAAVSTRGYLHDYSLLPHPPKIGTSTYSSLHYYSPPPPLPETSPKIQEIAPYADESDEAAIVRTLGRLDSLAELAGEAYVSPALHPYSPLLSSSPSSPSPLLSLPLSIPDLPDISELIPAPSATLPQLLRGTGTVREYRHSSRRTKRAIEVASESSPDELALISVSRTTKRCHSRYDKKSRSQRWQTAEAVPVQR